MAEVPATASTLRHVLRLSIVLTELEHTTLRLRLMTALLVLALMAHLQLMPAALLLSDTDESLIWRISAATAAGPRVTGAVLVALAALMLPKLVLLAGGLQPHRRVVRKVTVLSLVLTALQWLFLAYRATPLDLGLTHVVFAVYGIGALAFAAVMAWILNAEQLRLQTEHT